MAMVRNNQKLPCPRDAILHTENWEGREDGLKIWYAEVETDG